MGRIRKDSKRLPPLDGSSRVKAPHDHRGLSRAKQVDPNLALYSSVGCKASSSECHSRVGMSGPQSGGDERNGRRCRESHPQCPSGTTIDVGVDVDNGPPQAQPPHCPQPWQRPCGPDCEAALPRPCGCTRRDSRRTHAPHPRTTLPCVVAYRSLHGRHLSSNASHSHPFPPLRPPTRPVTMLPPSPCCLSSSLRYLVSLVLLGLVASPLVASQSSFSTFYSSSSPCGITSDPQGFIYTSTCTTGTIQKWDAQGNAVASFDTGVASTLTKLANASGIAVEPDYLAIAPSGDLWSIEAAGGNANALHISNSAQPTSATYLNLAAYGGAFGLAFTPNSSDPWMIFPACQKSPQGAAFQKFNCTQLMQLAANGTVLRAINTNAIPALVNATLSAITSDASGALYITAGSVARYPSYGFFYADYELIAQPGFYASWNVYKLSVTGQLLQTFVPPINPPFIYYSPEISPVTGNLFVPDYYQQLTYVFSPSGILLQNLTQETGGGGAPAEPFTVAASGDLVGLSINGISILDTAANGTPRFSYNTGLVPLSSPFVGGLNPAGTVLYVGSTVPEQAMATFSTNGTYLGSFARSVVTSAAGIDCDAQGNVYVADSGTSVIYKFTAAGVLLRNFSAPAAYSFQFGFNVGGALRVNRQTGAIAVNDGDGFTVLAADGTLITRLMGPGVLINSGELGWSSQGYLVYSANETVAVQALNGTVLAIFNITQPFFVSSGIVVTTDDRVIVSNIGMPTTSILMYSLSGMLLATIAPTTSGLNPWGLAYSPATPSFFYEFDVSNNRILTFSIPAAGTGGSARGDPQFVGLRGQSFQVHGIDGAVYALISEERTAVNARFVFLSSGRCPVIDGLALNNCYSHPGSYMGAMSFQVRGEDSQLHTAVLTAGKADVGFASVQVDGALLSAGQSVEASSVFSVQRTGTHAVRVVLPSFELRLENSDLFINLQQLTPRVPLSRLTSHGLLGQTHSATLHKSTLRYIEGEVDDYTLNDDDLLATEFVYSCFRRD